jgi:excisionase family DNA binding protein
MPPIFVDARDLAERLDVGYDTVLTWVRRGKIPHIRDGRGRLMFNLNSVNLVASGASVKTCQTLARHSTPSLTIGVYAKTSLHDVKGAVEALPDPIRTDPGAESLRMTGTDGGLTPRATSGATEVSIPFEESTQVQVQQWGESESNRHQDFPARLEPPETSPKRLTTNYVTSNRLVLQECSDCSENPRKISVFRHFLSQSSVTLSREDTAVNRSEAIRPARQSDPDRRRALSRAAHGRLGRVGAPGGRSTSPDQPLVPRAWEPVPSTIRVEVTLELAFGSHAVYPE